MQEEISGSSLRFSLGRQPQLVSGAGSVAGLGARLNADGHQRVALVTGGRSIRGREQWAQTVDDLLDRGIDFIDFTVRGEPSPDVVDQTVVQLRQDLPDCSAVVALGGGSVIDAAKATAALLSHHGEETQYGVERYLEGVGDRKPPGTSVPVFAVPSTAGTGSEATKNAVISRTGDPGFKKSLRHDNYVPRVVFLDPELHHGAPESVTRASGLDAITQLLEALVSTKANPVIDGLALQGLVLAGAALPALMAGQDSVEARHRMALAAYLSGVALANVGLGVVHGLASPIGAARDIPHGVVCGLLVGPATERILARVAHDHPGRRRYERAADALGVSGTAELIEWLGELAEPLGRLSDYGFRSTEISGLAARGGNKNSPGELTEQDRQAILQAVV